MPPPRPGARRRPRRKGTSLVGLDIGSTSVKAVRLRRHRKSHIVVALGVEPLPAGAVVDGAILDRAAVAAAVRKVFAEHAIRNPRVAVSLAGNAVIVKRVTLPAMSAAELRDAIYWEARQSVPFELDDVNLDYQVLAPAASGEAARHVLLVAAKKDRIAEYTDVVMRAGRIPVIVDVDAFALQNVYERSHGAEHGGTVALLNVGAGSINVNVVRDRQPVYTRDVPVGGNACTEALQGELGVGFADAERLKAGAPAGGRTPEDAAPVLQAAADDLVQEVARTLDFLHAAGPASEIGTLVLSGGGSRLDGLGAALGAAFDAPVVRLEPFRQMTLEAGRVSEEQRTSLAPLAAVAAGLALRRVDDR